jgi:hypothetical protein
MDILYTYKENGGMELRYSLRSIARYGRNVGRVFVIGDVPSFVSDRVTCISHPAPYAVKEKNIMDAIVHAAHFADMTDEFLRSSDDHFYVRPVDFDDYPVWRKMFIRWEKYHDSESDNGLLPVKGDTFYFRELVSTRAFLSEMGLPVHLFDIHRNTHLRRSDILECVRKGIVAKALRSRTPIVTDSLFCNYRYMKEPFVFTDTVDYKLKAEDDMVPEYADCFSTYDFKEGSPVHGLLESLFPDKCIYEK